VGLLETFKYGVVHLVKNVTTLGGVKLPVIKETRSICPECLRVLDASILEEDNTVYIEKECPEHGRFRDVYWSDYGQYLRAERFRQEGEGLRNPRTRTERGCPLDCGICPEHRSHTALGIIDVTNRCNLRCPVCFATAGTTGYVYEPTLEQIGEMIQNLRRNDPVPAPALQLSGGEPTIREDLFEIIRTAKREGFEHVEVNTNGLRLAGGVDYCRGLKEADVDTVYLQFDGLTPDVYEFTRGRDLVDVKMRAIENCREAGLESIVLVVTLVKGVNDHQLGDIIRFAAENFDVVRCVNVQPVSICGRVPEQERGRMRITIPDFMRAVEEQTGGKIRADDFYPVPTVVPISRAVGALRGRRYVEFTAHPHCGMATYIFVEGGEIVPITRYGNVEGFTKAMEAVYREASEGHGTRARVRLAGALRHVSFGLLRKHLWPVLRTGSYEALGDLHRRMLLVSAMHFMDPYNFDLDRVRRCCIHYAVPDGRIIPFCTMNSIHRPAIEKKFSVTLDQYRERKRGKA